MRKAKTPLLVKALRAAGLRQTALARLAGLSNTTVSRLCRGEREATEQERRQIAQALGLAEKELFDPFSGLESDAALVERACHFLRSAEGRLFLGRLAAALEG